LKERKLDSFLLFPPRVNDRSRFVTTAADRSSVSALLCNSSGVDCLLPVSRRHSSGGASGSSVRSRIQDVRAERGSHPSHLFWFSLKRLAVQRVYERRGNIGIKIFSYVGNLQRGRTRRSERYVGKESGSSFFLEMIKSPE